jgi:hypothetical protein
MPIEPGAGHADASELDRHIRTRRHRSNAAPPGGQHLVVLVGIGTGPQQAADVVQDDGQVGDGLGKIRKLWQLGEVHPALQGQSHAGQHASARPELRVA